MNSPHTQLCIYIQRIDLKKGIPSFVDNENLQMRFCYEYSFNIFNSLMFIYNVYFI